METLIKEVCTRRFYVYVFQPMMQQKKTPLSGPLASDFLCTWRLFFSLRTSLCVPQPVMFSCCAVHI